MKDVADLEGILGHRFHDPQVLKQALTHRSFLNEHPDVGCDNERLEYLGDAVLGFVVSTALFERFPDLDEGALSRARASIVSAANLVGYAESLDLGAYLRLGKGEDSSGGRSKPALLANALESVIGALYLDAGIDWIRVFLQRLLGMQIESIGDPSARLSDHKSMLQEMLQARGQGTASYRLTGEAGPDHRKTFSVELRMSGDIVASGTGPTRKAAEQAAARSALETLGKK